MLIIMLYISVTKRCINLSEVYFFLLNVLLCFLSVTFMSIFHCKQLNQKCKKFYFVAMRNALRKTTVNQSIIPYFGSKTRFL